MSLIADLKSLFAAAKVAKTIELAPPLETTVLDDLYPQAVRQTVDSPVIPLREIASAIKVLPLVRRGGPPINVTADEINTIYIEPAPIYMEMTVDGVELNNLKLMGMGQKENWARRKTLQARAFIKATLEAMAAQAAFNGQISHPMQMAGGGYVNWTATLQGAISTVAVAAADKWDHADAALTKVYALLENMSSTINKAGCPGTKTHYAGKTAFASLLALIEATDKPKIPVKIEAGKVIVGGHSVKKMDEVWTNPETGASVPKVPDKEVRTVASGYSSLFYAALDDLRANLRALPIFLDPIEEQRPSRLIVTAQSKPLPTVAPKAVAKATVVA